MVLLAAVPISVALGHRLRDRWQAALHVTVLLYLVGVIGLNAFLNATLTGELTARHILFPMIATGVAHLGCQPGDLWAERTQLRVDVGRAVKLDPRVQVSRESRRDAGPARLSTGGLRSSAREASVLEEVPDVAPRRRLGNLEAPRGSTLRLQSTAADTVCVPSDLALHLTAQQADQGSWKWPVGRDVQVSPAYDWQH